MRYRPFAAADDAVVVPLLHGDLLAAAVAVVAIHLDVAIDRDVAAELPAVGLHLAVAPLH